jgi:hypothetical protein
LCFGASQIVADRTFKDGYRTVVEARDHFLKQGEEEVKEDEEEKKRLEALATYIPSSSPSPAPPATSPPTQSAESPSSSPSNEFTSPSSSPDDDPESPPRRGHVKPVFGFDLSRKKLEQLKE